MSKNAIHNIHGSDAQNICQEQCHTYTQYPHAVKKIPFSFAVGDVIHPRAVYQRFGREFCAVIPSSSKQKSAQLVLESVETTFLI